MSDQTTRDRAAAALREIESGERDDFEFLFDGEPYALSTFLRTVADPDSDTDLIDLRTILRLDPGEAAHVGGGRRATFSVERPR